MKFSLAALLALATSATADDLSRKGMGGKGGQMNSYPVQTPTGYAPFTPFPTPSPPTRPITPTSPPTNPITPTSPPTNPTFRDENGFAQCRADGYSALPYNGFENSVRLLKDEGVIDEIPASLCGREGGKNVILVIGDGMGWEMVRAGSIAKQVLAELEGMGVDTKNGSPDKVDAVASAFAGRTLKDYYVEGKGSGLSFQDELSGFTLVTTSSPVIQKPEAGNHYAPSTSLLDGDVGDHENGMSSLALNSCGHPIDFNPKDYETEGGNMALWIDDIGGKYPWDNSYFQELEMVGFDWGGTDYQKHPGGFDAEYILQHAIDSANSAGAMATGVKVSVNMVSVDLYERDVNTIVEDAIMCGKSGSAISSVPPLHATPAAFISHSNNRNSAVQLRRSMAKVNPTYVMGGCGGSLQPDAAFKESLMEGGSRSSQWTFLYQGKDGATAENFYDSIKDLDPDDDQHILVCLGGEYTESRQQNLPYRGLDSTYDNRWCSSAADLKNDDGMLVGYTPTSTQCDHYKPEEIAQIPPMAENVRAALEFLGKDDDGFFLMYEQGDIDWAAHANHMDDMLGAMLDIHDSTQVIIDWIKANGGWEKNALYVTADHDHYLTLLDHFPRVVAMNIVMGTTHNMTPQNNSNKNPWSAAIGSKAYEDETKTQTELLKQYATWTDEDIEAVGHFWGPRGSGGNGWGSHSTRPVGLYYQGDDGCVEALVGKGFQVLGRDVEGSPEKIDQVHIHACMMKQLFNL